MAGDFIPIGRDLADPSETPKFVRREAPGLEPDDPDTNAPSSVTPAEAVDLAGRIRQILQEAGGLSAGAAENTATAIEAAVSAAPARVALPEIKITAPAAPEAAADGEGEEGPKLATIDYEREEERVKRIRVGCPCGETILLDCDFGGE